MAVRIVAVDWSGKLHGAAEFIWLADVRDGKLVSLENGRSREQLIDAVTAISGREPHTIVGLDFAFSFPGWWCEQRGWRQVREVWAAMGTDGDRLLDVCAPPFWGRPDKRNDLPRGRRYRATELADAPGAKSVFQVGGAGAVGTGSVRGMKHLLTLAERGFDVWPFGPQGWPRAVEIYPRLLTGPVNKSSWRRRHEFLFDRFPGQPAALLERAAGSEDAFDAAASALVMAEYADQLSRLVPADAPPHAIEGRIWRPL